uniref:Uncharacterized protein n=1 Tax=Arundo donax TaxID=35708 RepID=A0A0A9F8R8_ARUDO
MYGSQETYRFLSTTATDPGGTARRAVPATTSMSSSVRNPVT